MEAQLTIEAGGTPGAVFVLQVGETAIVGAAPGARIRVADPRVAPQHAALRVGAEGLHVTDLGGPAGTLVNGRRLAPRATALVGAGDVVAFGDHALRVLLLGQPEAVARNQRTVRLADPVVPRAQYEVMGLLGSGAAGKVYSAVRRRDGRLVAVKVLADALAVGTEEHARLLREAAAGSKLRSPHVVEVLEVVVRDDGRAFLVLELVDGPSVQQLLGWRGALSPAAALWVGLDVARAIDAASGAGVVHRDIKPANVLVDPAGLAKLTDFGIAKDLDSTLTSLTRSGVGLGSMAYMAPEQVSEAKRVDSFADVYALGATLYHMLAGAPPFEPRTPQDLALVVTQAPPPLRARCLACPEELVRLVERALAKAPDERPAPWKLASQLAALAQRLDPTGIARAELRAPA